MEGNRMAEIKWVSDYQDGLKAAAEGKKPLFLDFFKDG
jgi:hypothetical protein